jgi:hypothetical protein
MHNPLINSTPMNKTKRFVALLLLSFSATPALFAADQPAPQVLAGIPGQAISSAVVNFSELAAMAAKQPVPAPKALAHPVMKYYKTPGVEMIPSASRNGIAPRNPQPLAPSPAPSISFLALPDDTTSIPPDTMGAVGPNHVMTTLNTQVRIQNKTGTTISTVSLDSFWAAVGGSPSCFDPRLKYDPYNNRWIFAAAADGQLASSAVLIGVSQNSDPTGTWFLYKVDADGANINWADFPALGFNTNWIVVSVNMFSNAANGFAGVNIYVFNKTNLYAHGAGLFTLLQDTSLQGFAIAPVVTYDQSLLTQYLLEDWNSTSGQLRLSKITGPVGAESLTLGTAFPASSAWSQGGLGDFLPQLGSTRKMDGGDSRIGNCVYRNGTIWAAQTAFLPSSTPTRTAVQWWQIKTNGAVTQFGRLDDPSGVIFYAYPSIGVNANNDALIGYSRFSTNQYASGNYSFRYGSDAINTLHDDTVLKAGEGVYAKTYGGADNRWGDFSSTVVDPANDSTLWTLQEYAATPTGDPNVNENYSRWGTWWGRIDTGVAIFLGGTAITAENCLSGNGVLDPNETVTVNFTLHNGGSASTTNLVATLQAAGGVTFPSGAQSYGAMAGGASVTRAFSFTVNGTCGGTLTATLQLQDGAGNLGTVNAAFTLGVPNAPLTQKFDSVTPPALPAGWTAVNASGGATWTTTSAASDSSPNSAFVPDPAIVSDNRLTSPVFPILTASAVLTFRHNYDLEFSSATIGYDGGVLEISIAGGSFTDILAAGGSFAGGGYNHTIATGYGNPLAGRSAWSGNSGGFVTTTVNLPAAAAGQNVQLRWRCGTDNSTGATGWYVDTIAINDGYACCPGPMQPTIVNPRRNGTNMYFSFLSAPGQNYTVQYKDSLNDATWQTLQAILGDATFKTLTNGATGATRFYRLKSP